MRELMDVILNGKPAKRPVEHVEEIKVGKGKHTIFRRVPEVDEGEAAYHTIDGAVHIVSIP